ncbi:MAG: hypothetical protein WA712_07425, partial [Pseudolabrys sp.]
KGKAMMGMGEASGAKRVLTAAEAAISNPLIEDPSIKRASGLLISITGGKDLTLFEVDEAATRIREEADPDANILVGAIFDESLEGIVRVSVVATGIDNTGAAHQIQPAESALKELVGKLRNAAIAWPNGPSVLRGRPNPNDHSSGQRSATPKHDQQCRFRNMRAKRLRKGPPLLGTI